MRFREIAGNNIYKRFAKDFLISISILIVVTIISWGMDKFCHDNANIIMLYILGVVLISYFTGSRIYSLISSVLAVLVFNFFFTEPYFSFRAYSSSYPFTFIIMFLVAFFVGTISQSKNELLIKNKQEEMRSTLLRAISHDLRTPLTGISGFAEVLIKNAKVLSENKKHEIYTEIYEDSIWLLNLIENLLVITRFDRKGIKIKKESESISDVIDEAVSHLGRKQEKYDIQTDVEDDSISAIIDGQLIAQVIFNLVDNAIKYSQEGTKIKVGAKRKKDKVEVSVSDEGNGISESDKKRIFEMFYKGENLSSDGKRGLGLGLALCKTIINAHGGQIYVKDNKPKGTIFSFEIKGDFSN